MTFLYLYEICKHESIRSKCQNIYRNHVKHGEISLFLIKLYNNCGTKSAIHSKIQPIGDFFFFFSSYIKPNSGSKHFHTNIGKKIYIQPRFINFQLFENEKWQHLITFQHWLQARTNKPSMVYQLQLIYLVICQQVQQGMKSRRGYSSVRNHKRSINLRLCLGSSAWRRFKVIGDYSIEK